VSGSRLGEIAQAKIIDVLEDEGQVALNMTQSDDKKSSKALGHLEANG
jgi:hypothetical protein